MDELTIRESIRTSNEISAGIQRLTELITTLQKPAQKRSGS